MVVSACSLMLIGTKIKVTLLVIVDSWCGIFTWMPCGSDGHSGEPRIVFCAVYSLCIAPVHSVVWISAQLQTVVDIAV